MTLPRSRPYLPDPPLIVTGISQADIITYGERSYDAGLRAGRRDAIDLLDQRIQRRTEEAREAVEISERALDLVRQEAIEVE